MADFMKSPCEHCPFRRDVTPFLTIERWAELAYHAQNPYNSFACHKTTVHNDNDDEPEMVTTEKSKECAGFMTLQWSENNNPLPKGFKPSELVYSDTWEMIDSHPENN